jgi:glycosyltransferase involved in cell wall biosynthesis
MDPIRIAAVIPTYKTIGHIINVIKAIGPEVDSIIVVDDACPQHTGRYVSQNCSDSRVNVLYHNKNKGVGGAVITGYLHALENNADIIVKLDSDGQMDPHDLPEIVAPIINGYADYSKGNRFYDIDHVKGMPIIRLIGNAGLTFLSKLSSGYWSIFDPTNGYTAIHRKALSNLNLNKVAHGYFFESDMLFRLNLIRAVVVDVPIKARYEDETSSLSISSETGRFFSGHSINFIKRIFYTYYLRDFTVASIQLMIGTILLIFGTIFGARAWIHGIQIGSPATAGTVMIAALSIFIAIEFILAFFVYDYQMVPQYPLQGKLQTGKLWNKPRHKPTSNNQL